ncbi:MAG: ATP-dependent Clp protease ATP-binding subunit ClpX, partial [Bdellovibrionales bacterium]|nr:ATP-dependent Clp protease ATP-binding subunit ClpX [Bdellovibrionales bacterium]
GIAAEIKDAKDAGVNILQSVLPDDLVRFGLIPEFIGRLPVISVLDPLTEEALLEILVKPKNALTRQYQKLFGMDNVKLTFTEGALKAIAKESIKRKTGARGLRAVIEDSMLDIMFDIPSKPHVKECIIDEEVVLNKKVPKITYKTDDEIKAAEVEVKKTDSESA